MQAISDYIQPWATRRWLWVNAVDAIRASFDLGETSKHYSGRESIIGEYSRRRIHPAP